MIKLEIGFFYRLENNIWYGLCVIWINEKNILNKIWIEEKVCYSIFCSKMVNFKIINGFGIRNKILVFVFFFNVKCFIK